ncbi:hypothetical protein D9M69_497140 [compost metagenome]
MFGDEIERLRAEITTRDAEIEQLRADLMPSDGLLNKLRASGLSIDGDNAYKRDLLDCIVGALAFGKQRSTPPPAGHWLERFYEIGKAEADERDAQAAPVAAPDGMRKAVESAVAEALGDAYDCIRVWDAWSYGTMGPDDFLSVTGDADRVAEIADAAMAAMISASQPAPQHDDLTHCTCGDAYPATSYGAGFIDGSGMCPNCDAAIPAKDIHTPAARDVLAERRRQIEAEGMTTAGDDGYRAAELPRAAAAYILNGSNDEAPCIWPWAKAFWKPRDARKNYVRAGALILAEIERIDRVQANHEQKDGEE